MTLRRTIADRPLRSTALLALVMTLSACPKSSEGDKASPSPSASVSPVASAAPDGGSGAGAGASADAPEAKATSYAGTYSVAPGSIYIADTKEFERVKQAKDDPSKHVGEGAISLEVSADGRVSGTIDSGPAAPAVIDGLLTGTDLRGNVRRKDPKDDGLTGTLVATVNGGSVQGELSLAEAHAAIVRAGKVSLEKK